MIIGIRRKTDDENEDEIKKYTDKDGINTIIAVFEGDYVRFARELKDEEGKLAEEKIISQEEFKKMIELEGWKKEQDEIIIIISIQNL